MSNPTHQTVQSKYASVAKSKLSTDHAGVKAVAEAFGYCLNISLTRAGIGKNIRTNRGHLAGTRCIDSLDFTHRMIADYTMGGIADGAIELKLSAVIAVDGREIVCRFNLLSQIILQGQGAI